MPVIAMLLNKEWQIIYANQALLNFLGVAEEQTFCWGAAPAKP